MMKPIIDAFVTAGAGTVVLGSLFLVIAYATGTMPGMKNSKKWWRKP